VKSALISVAVLLIAACGGSATPPETSEAPSEPAASDEPAAEPSDSEPAKPEATAEEKPKEEAPDPATAEREVTYLQTPDGLSC
jgi:hypothetical protein